MAAQLEEVVLHADALDPEEVSPDPDQPLLGGVARRDERPAALQPAGVRRRQAPPVDLAVGVERQRVEQHERRRHHVVGQPRLEEGAELGRDAAREAALQRVVGVETEQLRPRPHIRYRRGARLGQERGEPPLFPATAPQHRIEAAGVTGRGPAQLDLVRQLAREVPDLLGLDRAGRGGGREAAQVAGRPALLLREQPGGGAGLGRPRVRHVAQAEGLGRILAGRSDGQAAAQGRERQTFALPVEPGDLDRRFCLVGSLVEPQHHLVAERGQLAVRNAALRMNLDPTEARQAPSQGGEEGGIDRQLVLQPAARLDLLVQLRERCLRRGREELQRGVERREQRQAAQVAQEDRAAGPHSVRGPREHLSQVVGAREVLRHRVDDHRVERAGREIPELLGRALAQLDPRAIEPCRP